MHISTFFYRLTIFLVLVLLATTLLIVGFDTEAANLDTSLPTIEDGNLITLIAVDLPSQPLAMSLKQFANIAGLSLAFDSTLISGKLAPPVKGRMSRSEALSRLLAGSGLEASIKANNAVIKRAISTEPLQINLKETEVRAQRFKNVGPMPGLNLTKEQIPGNIQSITAQDIKDAHALSLSDLLNSKLQSVNVNDYQGNPFQMDVTYRGFTASPQLGTPQGLSVFFDGIRVNEPFGDVVNWDMIPMNALDGMEIYPGSNPLFGLNTLGGALAVRTKSGFTTQGVNAEILAGSYGRKQLQASAGGSKSGLAAFGAVNLFMEDGWRKNSPSEVNQAFGKLEWQGDRASLSLSGLGIVNKLTGNGTVPLELYKEDPTAVFTSPDVTRNKLMQLQISGAFDVSDTFNITGMAYRRDSNRKSSTGDIIDVETFRGFGEATRKVAPGVTATCAYTDANGDGFPDYYLDALDPNTGSSPFLDDYNTNGSIPNYSLLGALNPTIPAAELERLKGFFPKNYVNTSQAEGFLDPSGAGSISPDFSFVDNGITYRVVSKPAVNENDCNTLQLGQLAKDNGRVILPALDANGQRAATRRDGAQNGIDGLGNGSGTVAGTPTGIITNSNIQQSTQGGSVQLNWNLEQHKFMVGVSIDAAKASYLGKQRFGVLDNNRNVTSDPSQLGQEFYAADHDVTINDFSGKLSTHSLYFSETWTPTKTLNLAFSSRYNYTDVQNQLAPQKAEGFGSALERLYNQFDFQTVCPGTDLSNCPIDITKPVPLEERLARGDSSLKSLDRKAMEKFAYHSLNPSVGATWQATPRLNLYANWNQGTRVPSVIELGCAYDGTIVPFGLDEFGNPVELSILRERFPNATAGGSKPRSLIEGRGCNLPSALSGDPYLPQVVAQTVEFGARGKFKELLEWNISAYQTRVGDDLYLVSATPQLSFFQSIGDTLRRGIEFGLSGEYGKSDFRLNYSLTEATFQSNFRMLSTSNSSTLSNDPRNPLYGQIQVNPGDRLPGVPLNNVNLSWGYKLTPALKIRFNLVGHSDSFVRGNENNEHTPGPGKGISTSRFDPLTNQIVQQIIPTSDYRQNGTSAGYAVLNFRGTYEIGHGWTAGVMVNNLLDKKYFSAGRLGLTPFAPSTYGAIGPGGFNYNSSEWISTQFMSGGAPRGIWFTLGYDFDASKKYDPPPSRVSMTEPDRTIPPEQLASSPLPTAQETALIKALDSTSTLPVIRSLNKSTEVAQKEVAIAIENWRKAWASNDVASYLQSYAASFIPENTTRESWEQQRKLQVVSAASPQVKIDNLIVAPQGKRMTAVFVQNYQSQQYQDTVKKMLYLEQQDGRWLIMREHATPISKPSGKPLSSLLEPELEQSKARPSLPNKPVIGSAEAGTKNTLRKSMGMANRVQASLNREGL